MLFDLDMELLILNCRLSTKEVDIDVLARRPGEVARSGVTNGSRGNAERGEV